MKKIFISMRPPLSLIMACTCLLMAAGTIQAQRVGIGTTDPDPSAILDITSDSTGLLIPRMTLTQRDAINNPATGLLVFVTTDSTFHYFDGTSWLPINGRTRMLVDADGDTKIQVEENPDDDAIRFSTAGTEYWRLANGRLEVLNTGKSLMIGKGAGLSDDLTNNNNIYIGDSTGAHVIVTDNLAIGNSALKYCTGLNNVVIGQGSMENSEGAYRNSAVGYKALYNMTTGADNAVLGYKALYQGAGAAQNVAIGSSAMTNTTTGSANVAVGANAMEQNTGGYFNTAVGQHSMHSNTTGENNVAIGYFSLHSNQTGDGNTSLGKDAGYSTLGSNSVFIGNQAGYNETAGNRLYIANSNVDSTGALIYGEFDNDLLRINGRLIASMGLSDADGDTKIEMEQTPDDDTIRFNMGGTEHFRMANGRLEVVNTGGSVFIGEGAGASDYLTDNRNVFIGIGTGTNNTTGSYNTASGSNALSSNTTGRFNTASGSNALYSNAVGWYNTASGFNALSSNTAGQYNTASGSYALSSNTAGQDNTASGYNALSSNTTGQFNTASGSSALSSNTTGQFNTASGYFALSSNTTGWYNTAFGRNALSFNETGQHNTAVGNLAMENNSVGSQNTGIGRRALFSNATGAYNTALGNDALYSNTNGSRNLALGTEAGYYSTGDSSIYIGNRAGYNETGSNRLYIQNSSAPADSALIYGEFDNHILAFNAKVGIGTTTPAYPFHVMGQGLLRDTSRATLTLQTSDNSKDVGLAFQRSGANYQWNIFRDGNTDDLVFAGGNNADITTLSQIMRITTDGAVGIGTEIPAARLHVSGGDVIVDRGTSQSSVGRQLTIGGARGTSGSAYATIAFSNYDNSGSSTDYTGASIASTNATGNDSGDLRFYTAEADSTAKERMIISPLGRIGIGTSSPSVSLNVANGDVRIDRGSETGTTTRTLTINGAYASGASPFAQMNFENYDSNDGASNYVAASITSTNANMHASGDLSFWTTPGGNNLTQRMTITEEGAVGIGTASPDTRLDVSEVNPSGAVATIQNGSISNNGIGLIVQAGPLVNPTNQFIRFKDGDGTIIGSVAGDGAGGIQYNTTSDRRLKTDIRTFGHGLPLLMQMRPAIYQRKSKPGLDEIGFIAQEMYDVFPQIVTGTPDQPVDNPMMVDYGRLTPVLVAAIQEQQHILDQQKDEIAALKKELDTYRKDTETRLVALENKLLAKR
jgi:hypothetical protein